MQNIWEQFHNVRLKQAMKMWGCIYKNEINQKILSSDQIKHNLPRLQRFHDPHEHVILNSIEESYNRLMRNCLLWLGPSKNLKKQWTKKSIVFLQNQQQLLLFYKHRCQHLQILHIFSWIGMDQNQAIWNAIKILQKSIKVQYHKITEPGDESIERILQQIGNNSCLQFPSFSQISVQQNKKINNERFWMYSVFNGINFRKSYQQFMQFLKYFIDNQSSFHSEILMELYNQCKRDQGFHDPVKYLRLYTGQWGLYRFLNMCLRSWSDSKDLGHIRFPFLQIFVAIKMLQNEQKNAFIQRSQAGLSLNSPIICYRASGLKIKQLIRMKKGNLIQMTGYLSTSASKYVASSFFKSDVEINILFIIKIPQMERSFNIFHSFCQVKCPISVYSEEQIILTPLNTFEVDKAEISTYHNQLLEQYQRNINDQLQVNRQDQYEIKVENSENNDNYSKVYLNYIDCEKRLKQLKSKKNLSGKQKIFIENYKFQKDMFRLTRNQGELLWRLHNIQDALQYYLHQFQAFLNIQKKNIGKKSNVDMFQTDKYLKQLIDPATVKRLDAQLKKILRKFEWFEDREQNLILIKNFICNHPYRNYCLFFYTAKVYNGMLFYERGAVFLELCFLYMLFLYKRKAAGVYIAASNYSVTLARLDIYDISHDFMRRALKFADINKIRVGLSNFTFLAIHLINCQQTSTNQSIQDNYIRIVKDIMFKQQTCTNKDHAWIQFIENLGDINQISKFKQYYNTNFGPPPIFLIFVCVYELKMSLLRNQIYHFSDAADHDKQQRNFFMNQLKVAKKCLDSFGKQQLKQISTLTKVLSQAVLLYQAKIDVQGFIDEWPDKNQFKQDFTYYIFRTHVEAIRYIFKLFKKVKNIPIKKYIRQLETAIKLSRKFANNSYLNMMMLLSLCEFCLGCYAITGHPGYRNLCVPFLKMLIESRKRIKYIKQLDRLQIELMKAKVLASFKKTGKQYKLMVSKTKTLEIGYTTKLTITQSQ